MVGGEVFGEGRGDRCDPGGEAYLADGGGQRQRSTLATGRSGGRSARNEPDFVRRAREVTGTLTVTEPKRGRLPAAPRYVPDPAPRPRTTEALHRHGTLPNHAGFRRIPVSSGTGGGAWRRIERRMNGRGLSCAFFLRFCPVGFELSAYPSTPEHQDSQIKHLS